MNWKQIATIGTVCVALLTLWMHRYHYEYVENGRVIRIHRITGSASLLQPGDGWVTYEQITASQNRNHRDSSDMEDTLTRLERAQRRLKRAGRQH